MSEDNDQTNSPVPEFDDSPYPRDSLFHERRNGAERRDRPPPADADPTSPPAAGGGERRAKKERRRRIDPTTFEKQYTDDELEFMNAMQRFKELSGKTFPNFRDVIKVAVALGYRRAVVDIEPSSDEIELEESLIIL